MQCICRCKAYASVKYMQMQDICICITYSDLSLFIEDPKKGRSGSREIFFAEGRFSKIEGNFRE